MKHFISRRNFLKAAGVTAAASAMAAAVPQASAGFLTGKDAAVTILYTNDVHTYIDNKSPKLTYAAIAAMKQGYVDEGKPVLLVDAGDHIQGTAYGSMDDGATIIELMNEAGYDIATPGNHEFDYGMARAKAIIKEADFPYVSCNWVDLRTGLRVLPAVKLFPAGGKWIAFVGITTPESFTKSTPAYFMNAKQTKYIYDILGGDDGRKLYDAVQKAIDKAKALGADIIIGLGHLGVDPSSSPWTSEEVIANTTGFDAFIDGHSHTVMENKQVYDAAGKAVTLTQTGSYLANVGKMTIAEDGAITTELISTADVSDAAVAATAEAWINDVDAMLGEQIATTDIKFYINDPATSKRRIRMGETNLGDFVADGIYTYFNEVEQLDCDIAMMNGGGIRTDVDRQVDLQDLQAGQPLRQCGLPDVCYRQADPGCSGVRRPLRRPGGQGERRFPACCRCDLRDPHRHPQHRPHRRQECLDGQRHRHAPRPERAHLQQEDRHLRAAGPEPHLCAGRHELHPAQSGRWLRHVRRRRAHQGLCL